jgi:hypothetical protein
MESLNRGFNAENLIIPALAYSDDIVILDSSIAHHTASLKRVERYFSMMDLKLSLGNTTKTVHSNNHPEPVKITLSDGSDVPTIEASAMYKYLGIHINLDLTWQDQVHLSITKFHKTCNLLRSIPITPLQTIHCLKVLAYTPLRYLAGIVPIPTKSLKQLDATVKTLLNSKWRTPRCTAIEPLYIPTSEGGLGLPTVQQSYTISSIHNVYTQGLNSSHPYTLHTSSILYLSNPYLLSPYLKDLRRLNTCIRTNNLTHPPSSLNRPPEITLRSSNGHWKSAKSPVAAPTHRIPDDTEPSIKKLFCVHNTNILNPYLACSLFPSNPFIYPPTHNPSPFTAFTDGSLVGNTASWGVVIQRDDPPFSQKLGDRVIGPQTILNAELQAILCALISTPPNTPLKIVTDSKTAIQIIQSNKLAPPWKVTHADVALMIKHTMNKRSGQTELLHILSHTLDNTTLLSDHSPYPNLPQPLTFRQHVNASRFPLLHAHYARGNMEADLTCKNAIPFPDKTPVITSFHLPFQYADLNGTPITTSPLRHLHGQWFHQITKPKHNTFYSHTSSHSWSDSSTSPHHLTKLTSSIWRNPEVIKNSKIQQFIYKLWKNILPSRFHLCKRLALQRKILKISRSNDTLPDKYTSDHCPFHPSKPETIDHILRHCSRYITLRNELVQIIHSTINSFLNISERIPSIDHIMQPFDDPLTARGFIPKTLPVNLRTAGVHPPKIPECINRIQLHIITKCREIWHLRCNEFHKEFPKSTNN